MNHFITRIPDSVSFSLAEMASSLQRSGVSLINLSGGEPDFNTPLKIRDAAVKSLQSGRTHYSIGQGIPDLREKISQKFQKENSISCTPDQIIVTPGGKFACYLTIMSLINPGDEVLVLNPGWVSYSPIVDAAGGSPIPIELDPKNNYEITLSLLEKNITSNTKMIILNSPNNPTGRVLTEKEAEILTFVIQKYHLYLLSDEIYEKIIFDGRHHISLGARDIIKDQVITVNGFSKAFAMTGWRLAYLHASDPIVKTMKKLYAHTITGCPTFIQDAAIHAFDRMDEVQKMCSIYQERRDYFINELNQIPGVHAIMPEGAFYAWVSFNTLHLDSFQMTKWLMEKAKVIGMPGGAYSGHADRYIRFSFAADMNELHTVIANMRQVL